MCFCIFFQNEIYNQFLGQNFVSFFSALINFNIYIYVLD